MAYRKFLFVATFTILVLLSGIPTFVPVFAQSGNDNKTYKLLEPLPCIESVDEFGKVINSCTAEQKSNGLSTINMGDFFQYAFNILIAVAAVAAVFMMVYGGFIYVTTDSWFDKSRGWSYVKDAILGLLMILGSYIILKTVNPKLVSFPKSIPAIKVQDSELVSTSDFFQQLSMRANNFKIVDSTKLKSDIIQAQVKEKAIRAEMIDIAQKWDAAINKKASSDELAMWEDKMAEKKDEIIQVQGQISMDTTLVGFEDKIEQIVDQRKVITLDELTRMQEQINKDVENTKPKIVNLAQEDQKSAEQKLLDGQNFMLGLTTLQKVGLQANITTMSDIVAGAKGALIGGLKGLQTNNYIPVVGNMVGGTVGTSVGFIMDFENNQQKRLAADINAQVIKVYADKISDPNLKDQLVTLSNSVVKGAKLR